MLLDSLYIHWTLHYVLKESECAKEEEKKWIRWVCKVKCPLWCFVCCPSSKQIIIIVRVGIFTREVIIIVIGVVFTRKKNKKKKLHMNMKQKQYKYYYNKRPSWDDDPSEMMMITHNIFQQFQHYHLSLKWKWRKGRRTSE